MENTKRGLLESLESNKDRQSQVTGIFKSQHPHNQQFMIQSQHQKKRNQFQNKIRQHQRDTYKHNLRQKQLQFLLSIGIFPSTSNNTISQYQSSHLLQHMQQQQQQMQTDFFLNGQIDEDIYSKCLNQEITREYEEIRQYQLKEYKVNQLAELWEIVKQEVQREVLGNKKEKEKEIRVSNVKWMIQTAVSINHILAADASHQTLELTQLRRVQPHDYSLILQWLYLIYSTYSQQKIPIPLQLQQRIVTMVLLIIGLQLKLQLVNELFRMDYMKEKKENLWSNRVLFDKVLEIPWLWGHWIIVCQAKTDGMSVYAANRVIEILWKEVKRLEDMILLRIEKGDGKSTYGQQFQDNNLFQNQKDPNNNNNNNILECLQGITQLITYCQQILHGVMIKQKFSYREIPMDQMMSGNLQSLVCNAYRIMNQVSRLIHYYLRNQSNTNTQIIIIQTIIRQSRLISTCDRLHWVILEQKQYQQESLSSSIFYNTNYDNNNQDNNSSNNNNNHHQQQLNKYLTQRYNKNKLNKDHFIPQSLQINCLRFIKYLQSRITVVCCKNSQQQQIQSSLQMSNSDIYEMFQTEYVTVKLIAILNILKTLVVILHGDEINMYRGNLQLVSNSYTKCLNLVLFNILDIVDNPTLRKKIFSQKTLQSIISVQQLVEILNNNTILNGNNNTNTTNSTTTTVCLVLLCRELLTVFTQLCNILNFDQMKKEITQKQSGSILHHVFMIMKTLNMIAESENHNIWKYACLLYQVTENNIIHNNNFLSAIDQCHNFITYLCNHFARSVKSSKLMFIKSEIGVLTQNIVYNYFPFQHHFQEFSIDKSQNDYVQVVMRLGNSYDEMIDGRNIREKSIQIENNNYDNEDSRYKMCQIMFSQQQLDKQTQRLLRIVQILLQETSIQAQLKAIKILKILLLFCDEQSSFNYFSYMIKGSTNIYKIIEQLVQEDGLSAVSGKGEEVLEMIDAGFEGDGEIQQNGKI